MKTILKLAMAAAIVAGASIAVAPSESFAEDGLEAAVQDQQRFIDRFTRAIEIRAARAEQSARDGNCGEFYRHTRNLEGHIRMDEQLSKRRKIPPAVFDAARATLKRLRDEDCPKKTVATQTAAAPGVGGIYIAPVVGNTNTCTNQTFTSFISLGIPDPFTPGTRSECSNGFAGGAAIGMPVATVPNPFPNLFRTAETAPPRRANGSRWGDYSPVVLGVEATLLGSTARNPFTGSPALGVGPGPETDTYTVKDNLMMSFSGTATIPTGAGFNVVVSAGYGFVNKTVTYNCNGFCTTAAGIPARSTSTDVRLGGPVVGAGIQVAVPNLPFIMQFDYSHWFIGERTILLGDPAAVQAGFRASQDINLFTARAVIPLGALLPR